MVYTTNASCFPPEINRKKVQSIKQRITYNTSSNDNNSINLYRRQAKNGQLKSRRCKFIIWQGHKEKRPSPSEYATNCRIEMVSDRIKREQLEWSQNAMIPFWDGWNSQFISIYYVFDFAHISSCWAEDNVAATSIIPHQHRYRWSHTWNIANKHINCLKVLNVAVEQLRTKTYVGWKSSGLSPVSLW